jgi:hypothetical protein
MQKLKENEIKFKGERKICKPLSKLHKWSSLLINEIPVYRSTRNYRNEMSTIEPDIFSPTHTTQMID